MFKNYKKDKNTYKTFVFKRIILLLVFMLCFENVCFSHENLATESIFGPLNGEQVNQIGELEAHILMKLLHTFKNGTNLLEKAKTGQKIKNITFERPYDQTKEITIEYKLHKIQKESKNLPHGYYIVPSIYNNTQYYHFIRFSNEDYGIETFTEQEYLKLNKNLLQNLVPLTVRKEDKRIKAKRKHEIEIDSFIWKKAKQGNLEIIQNNASMITELSTPIDSLGIAALKNEIQMLIDKKRFFLITGDVETLSFVGHASDRGIYLVEGKGDNLPVLFWEIMKFRGAKQEQQLGVRAEILRWQKNKKNESTIETLKNYLVRNVRKTTLRNYPHRAYWGTENDDKDQLLLELSEVISKIEETQKLIKIQKHISAIETKLAEDRKKQTMFDPNDIAIWKSYVEALAVIKKSSEKLQAINLNSQDTILHNFFKNETDLQIERIISELFNLNGVSSKTNYRNFSHKFHPDKIAQLRKRVSASVVKDMRIEEKFKKVYGFITSAWDFYLKKNGNADEHTDNLMKRAMELGKTPDALWKAFDVEKAIKIIDQSIKHLEAKKNTLKQDMTYDEASEETLQNLERRKRKTMKMLGAIDQESLKHKTEAVKAEYHKTIEEARTEKEKVENYAKQIFADQVMRINEEKEKNNKKYKKERLLEYRKQEKAIADAKEKCSQRYREIRKAQDQTEQEFRDKRYEAYQIEEQDKKTAENVYHSEWKKIYDRKKIAIKNIEEKESQE